MSPCSDGQARDEDWRRRERQHHLKIEGILDRVLDGELSLEAAEEKYEAEKRAYKEWMETH